MTSTRIRIIRIVALLIASLGLASCEDPQVYGSVGVSSSSWNSHGNTRMTGGISVGGRICC